MKTAALFSISLLALAGTASAQGVECHASSEFFIAEKAHADDVGSQFAVTALAGKPKPTRCAFDAKKATFVIGKPGDPLHFENHADALLILSRSTGPQGDLVVYDLKARKAVLDVPSDDYALEGDRITFWQRTVEATRKNCKTFAENQKNGFLSMISVQKVFDIKAGTVKDLGKSRCDSVQ